jgi:hypothetical protein
MSDMTLADIGSDQRFLCEASVTMNKTCSGCGKCHIDARKAEGLCLDPCILTKQTSRTDDIVTLMQDTVEGTQLRQTVTGTADVPSVLFISNLDGLTRGRSQFIEKLKDIKSWESANISLRTGPARETTRYSPDQMVKLWSACANQWTPNQSGHDQKIVQFDNWSSAHVDKYQMGEFNQLNSLSPLAYIYRPGADQRSLIAGEKEAGMIESYRRYSAFLLAHRQSTGAHIDTISFGQADLGKQYKRYNIATNSTTSAIGVHVAGWKGWWSSRGSTLSAYVRWDRQEITTADGLTANDITLLDIWDKNVISPRLAGVNMFGNPPPPPLE